VRGLNLDQLRAFSHVVDSGSFSAAAARLNLSQPAVSLQVRQLERRFGARLVERAGRRAQPTAAGRELLAHIGPIEAAVAAAVAAMAPHAEGVAGRVRLGTGATACTYLLPPLLRDLRLRFPRLDIVVRTGNSPDMLKALDEDALDLALVTLPAPGRRFAVGAVLDEEIVAVFPPTMPPPAAVTAAALAKLPVVLYEPGGNTRRLIDDWFRRAGVALRPVMELGNVEAIKQLVAAGLGCGLLPRRAADGAELGLRPLRPLLMRRLGLVTRQDKVPERGLAEVMRALAGLCRGDRAG
jgi:DNA-binding transcriptional LysR family regulator